MRIIFRRYLEVGGINELARDLKERNICTKARTFSTGKTRGGIPFGRGTLSHLLRNRFFIGEVAYKGEILPGEQPPIMDKTLFDEVQKKLSTHQSHETLARHQSEHLLKDIIFDDAGHSMTATHATKANVRYRYYVSRPSLHGEARTAKLGSVSRVPAPEIEQAVVSALNERLSARVLPSDKYERISHQQLTSVISRIEVHKTRIVITLKSTDEAIAADVLSIVWQKPPFRRSREILLPHGAKREDVRPDRAERRARLVNAIARGRCWLDEIVTGFRHGRRAARQA